MELRQLQYFICLYEEGSVTRAARRLNIVQPALSMQIAKLEDELGQKLFVRLPKGMAPTEAGHEAYHLFTPVVRDLSDAQQELANRSGRIGGHVSVGVVTTVSNRVLARSLADFSGRYPDVRVSATGGFTLELIEAVRAAQMDFAIINRPRGRSDLPSIPLLDEELVLVSALETPLPVPSPVALPDAAHLKLVIPSKRHGLRAVMDQAAESIGLDLQPRIELDEINSIEDFVRQTDWFSILPSIAIHEGLANRSLRAHRIVSPRITRHLMCIYSPRRQLSAAARLLVEVIGRNLTAAAEAVDPQAA